MSMELNNKVRIWEEAYVIPTYKIAPPEKSPLFIEKRAYQGSTGKVYPLPVTEKILDEKEDVTYKAVFLENEYLKIMVLPELGGRIQRAFDKTNNYDFVYYNHVIKPALVGLTGPWISGGIEFNWPQHHRPSTYSPVDYTLTEHEDGSSTVYVGETDKMYGTKGMAAITLHPGKSYIEIKGRLYNPTDIPQTFLWWANPAVPANDHTFSVFPPDVNAVMDHGKRAVSTFPIATGEYYKADYSAGVDISRYKNVPVPTSYMAAHSDYDFIGNYDESVNAGLIHVADHHISPGKKQWTWGNGDFGRTWDRNLTDSDGPYIELMTGVFTDNQPDFTWLKPHEEKTFTQYFMPYKGVGRIGNATKDAVINLVPAKDDKAILKAYATAKYDNALIKVWEHDQLIFEIDTDLSPESFFETEFAAPKDLSDCKVIVSWKDTVLAQYSVYKEELKPIPEPADLMAAPKDMKSLEELYLAATHLEQYRHATFEPADYYLEGLRRDDTDIRLNNGYGLLLYKRGLVAESIPYFEAAIKKQTWKTPNPYNGDGYFNLALALDLEGEEEKAFDAFYKATWSHETASSSFYHLSCISTRRGNYKQALEFVDKALIGNWHNMKARTLKAALLRKLGQDNSQLLKDSLAIDPLSMGCLYEEALLKKDTAPFIKIMREEAHNYLELSLTYIKMGLYEDAGIILSHGPAVGPMLNYYLGYTYYLSGEKEKALAAYKRAEDCTEDYCFPNRIEEIYILKNAISLLGLAPMANYYLGNLYYDKKQYDTAISLWETGIAKKPSFGVAYRNLAIAYYNKKQDTKKALSMMETACKQDETYPRHWLEYDQLASRANISIEKRLEIMESHMDITKERDALYLRYITLLNCMGRYEEALSALENFNFHPWEGGEGKVSGQYRYALIQLAKIHLDKHSPEEALTLLTKSLTFPPNLGEGKLPNVPDNETYYYMGLAYKMMEQQENAKKYFELASLGSKEPEMVRYYNDQPSDFIFYQGLASRELGDEAAARKAFHQLVIFGEKHIFDKVDYDYFAVSLPEIEVFQDDIKLRHTQYCNYLQMLGSIGLERKEKASKLLASILNKQTDYQSVYPYRSTI